MKRDQSRLDPKIKTILHKQDLLNKELKKLRNQCSHGNFESESNEKDFYDVVDGWTTEIVHSYYCKDCGHYWVENNF